jgi:hypothetical protein
MGANTVIGIPEREGDFERNCVVLFSELIGDPYAKLVATRGKDQGGFDIIGTRDGDPDRPVGIQCKNKPNGGRLDLDAVRGDIDRMLAFTPPVTEIFVVTTASDDLKYDKLALEAPRAQRQLADLGLGHANRTHPRVAGGTEGVRPRPQRVHHGDSPSRGPVDRSARRADRTPAGDDDSDHLD